MVGEMSIEILETKEPVKDHSVHNLLSERVPTLGYIVVFTDHSVVVSKQVYDDAEAYMEVFEFLSSECHISVGDIFWMQDRHLYNLFNEVSSQVDSIDQSTTEKFDTVNQGEVLEKIRAIVKEALARKATDIHMDLDLSGHSSKVYFRENGEVNSFPVVRSSAECKTIIGSIFEYHAPVANFSLDRDEDTQLDLKIEGAKVEVRVKYRSATATRKQAIFRITNTGNSIRTLDELGLESTAQNVLLKSIGLASGMILISGPTGSGKSTLMYSVVSQKPAGKICHTLEDPIEVQLPDPLTFQGKQSDDAEKDVSGLMRNDIDIGVVGEMRLSTQAEASIHLARTGHLIISSIHANDALSIPDRLEDMGIDRKKMGSSGLLKLLTAQRLVPVLCEECKEPLSEFDCLNLQGVASQGSIDRLRGNIGSVFKKGTRNCRHCDSTGITGRRLVFEYIYVDDRGREFILSGNNFGWLAYLRENGWKSMADKAWELIIQGKVDPLVANGIVPDLLVDASSSYVYGTHPLQLRSA